MPLQPLVQPLYPLLANLVLALHLCIVLFVIGGLLWVLAGGPRGWPLVRAWWFRLAHLAVIAVVVSQAWLGQVCPLTTLEMWLRTQARSSTYSGGFIEHWLSRLLYYDAPAWVFTTGYTVFGLMVLLAWWRWPPGRGRGAAGGP